MEKMNSEGMSLEKVNIEKIKELFPECVVDGKIDFDLLKNELGESISTNEEYRFSWNGKSESLKKALVPSTNTLLPCKEKSFEWDKTRNIYVEGDNLEVLKTLSKTFHNSIKMIYIDPPYNTGNDFVYNDSFVKTKEEFILNSLQQYKSNPSTSGRYHTDWLNMMYPRLKLAHELLKNDGLIIISIDEHEITNLSKICDEIFDPRNLLCQLIWRKSKGSGNDSKYLMVEHEYLLMYAKNIDDFKFDNELDDISDEKFPFKDEFVESRGRYNLGKLDRGSKGYVKSLDYGVKTPDGTYIFPNGRDHQENDGWRWMWSEQKLQWGLENGFIVLKKNNDGVWSVYSKSYALVDNENKPLVRTKLYKSHLGFDETILNISANAEIKDLFGKAYFSYPKPTKLIEKLLGMVDLNGDYVLDFFSGSGTTAHSLFLSQINKKYHANFILVQLNEKFEENTEQYQQGYHDICDLAEERIRRAAAKLKNELKEKKEKAGLLGNEVLDHEQIDFGFKVFKLDSTCIKPWDPMIKYDENSLFGLVDVIKEGRTQLDVAYEVMLKYGVFNMPLEEITVNNKKVFSVGNGYMIISLNDDIETNDVEEIARLQPKAVVFKESGFADDNAKINADYTFKRLGIDNVKCI